MFICFGISWPFAIRTTLKKKTAKGVNPVFLVLILVGYLSGLSYKLTGKPAPVIGRYAADGEPTEVNHCMP